MLTLRPKQMDRFERQAFAASLQRVERALAKAFAPSPPDAPLFGGDLSALVERSLEIALPTDIQHAPDLAAFTALGLGLRREAIHPVPDWIHGWLRRTESPGPVNLAVIEARLAEMGTADPAWQRIADVVRIARSEAA